VPRMTNGVALITCAVERESVWYNVNYYVNVLVLSFYNVYV